MKQFSIVFLFLLGACSTKSPEEPPSQKSPLDIVSFHQGYIYQEQLKIFGNSCNLDPFIAGMRASKEGKPSPFSDEVIESALTRLGEELPVKQKKENLELAEHFLKEIASAPEISELVPQKLYYKVLKKGNGQPILDAGFIDVIYQALTLKRSGEELQIFSRENPVEISVADTIPGFAQGIKEMKVGERRKLFIHPELAYGSYGGKLEPNQLLIIELEIIGIACPAAGVSTPANNE